MEGKQEIEGAQRLRLFYSSFFFGFAEVSLFRLNLKVAMESICCKSKGYMAGDAAPFWCLQLLAHCSPAGGTWGRGGRVWSVVRTGNSSPAKSRK